MRTNWSSMTRAVVVTMKMVAISNKIKIKSNMELE